MPPFRNLMVLLLLSVVIAAIGLLVAPASAQVTHEQVEDGIHRLKGALYKLQNPDGSFETKPREHGNHRSHAGETALAVYALLAAGESYQDPRLARAIAWLQEQKVNGTYALGLRCHVWSQLPDRFLDRLKQDVSTLDQWKAPPAGAQSGAIGWSYGKNVGRVHTSTGQYGVLGFWEGAKRGLPISTNIWRQIEAYYITGQNADGGWGYGYQSESRLSMACAGLTCLYITQDYAHNADYRQPGAAREHPLTDRLEKGLAYMDKHFAVGGRFPWYTLYGCERVGLASGRRYFGRQDWYAVGAAQILKTMGTGDGPFSMSSHGHAAAGHGFCLLFLVRGGVPVMVNKLDIPDYDWNNRPRDMANLVAWVSDTVEREINWQVQSIKQDPAKWMDAPILYLASHKPLKLTDAQAARIKRYIDLGGLLVTVADHSSEVFAESVEDLMRRLYPRYEYRPLESDDVLSKIVFPISTSRVNISTLHNGVRHLAVHIPNGDSSWAFHAKLHTDPTPWQLFVNIYSYATSKQGSRPRLGPHLITRQTIKGDPPPKMTVARVVYDGNHDPEPLAWHTQANHMFNQGKADLMFEQVDLSQLHTSDAKFAQITGTDPIKFSDAQIQSVRDFAQNGGTVVFENAGGHRSEFNESVIQMLADAFPDKRIRPVSMSNPAITGEGIGGYDVTKVGYRHYVLMKMGAIDAPRLMAVSIDEEPRIFVVSDDLTHAMLAQPNWGVFGYNTESAQKIMTNLVLVAYTRNP